jgi:hypothetical protein
MSYIIVVRNPRTKKLAAICDDEDGHRIAEYPSQEDAHAATNDITVCKAWSYALLEVPES